MSAGDWKEMFNAIEPGDINLITYYLKMGVDANYQHPEYMALPLVESIRLNKLEIAKLFLEHGANPNTKEYWGSETAWSVARSTKNKKAIQLLESFE